MKSYWCLLICLCWWPMATALALESAPPHIGPVGLRFNHLHALKVEKMVQANLQDKAESAEDQDLAFLLRVGKRASLWLEVVNQHRDREHQLDLSAPVEDGPSKGVPITAPMKTSTDILMKRYREFLEKTPQAMTSILSSSVDFPPAPLVDEAEFLKGLRGLDRIYQASIRWAGSREWLSWYINRSLFDIRGYLFLQQTPSLPEKLANFSTLSLEDQQQLKDWLLGLCRNGDFDSSDCLEEFKRYSKRNNLNEFYGRFNRYGKSMYDLFFTIKKTRPEIHWNAEGTQLISPFKLPERADVTRWLKENVEDEWQNKAQSLSDFQLIIDYIDGDKDVPRIQFKEGVTANVNGIAGNLITMEAEYPIESRDQKWTIRHEYGHVLGLEDCYLEFYDTNEKAMIYYEVDVENLMCSRSGKLRPTHIEQLRNAYR